MVQGHVMLNNELHYHLDVQEAAPFQRVKAASLPETWQMAPTIPALDVLESGEQTFSKGKREVEGKDVEDVEPPSMFTFASGKMLQKEVENETLEDSIALRVASTARPKAKAAGVIGQFSETEGVATLPTAARVEPSLQDLKTFLERVERPSNLFSQKTFMDEPHFGLEISKHSLPDALSELSVSLPVGRTDDSDDSRCFQEIERPPETGEGSSRVERLSEIFSRKTFLDEPRFGLSTSESLVDGEQSSQTYRTKKGLRILRLCILLVASVLRLDLKVSNAIQQSNQSRHRSM